MLAREFFVPSRFRDAQDGDGCHEGQASRCPRCRRPPHGPGGRVVDHDGVDGVDDAVGALNVGPDHPRLLLLPSHVVVLVSV